MKRSRLFVGIVCISSIIYPKALLVRYPTRSTHAHHSLDQQEIQERLFADTCKTILINAQDPLMMLSHIRYLEPLHARGKKIICKAPESMRLLLSWCPFIDQIEANSLDDTYDLELSLEDLAQLTHIRNNMQSCKPALIVEETIRSLWQEACITDNSFRVGVSCAPLSYELYKEKNPLTIESFFPLGCMQHTSLYCLDPMSNVIVPDTVNLYHFDTKKGRFFADLVAIIDQLDLVITTQPIIVYLAGALGKTVWLIANDTMQTEDMHKACPQLRIFQKTEGNEVIFDILHALAYAIEKPASQIVTAEIATGELIDKMTILQIKAERIADQKKLDNIWKELHSLQRTFDEFVAATPELEQLTKELKAANEALWVTEDLIRDKEREKAFDTEFITLARSVYIQNDERCRVKREINEVLGSRIIEEKSYKPYN